LNFGTGFRVVNIFTEDHAALTGARKVEIEKNLNPEKSYNVNLNFIQKFFSIKGLYMGIDASLFYTYFDNKIIANYEIDPNKIIYSNIDGHAISQGFNMNLDFVLWKGIKIMAGMTYMDVASVENGTKISQILTEKVTGTWSASYKIEKIHLNIDYTGNLYSPMRLPLLGELDPRNEFSPWWSIQNINLVFSGLKNMEIYGGVKNLLNWTPNKGNPFIIARSNDPFDKNVQFDAQGNAIATATNPYGLTFDPAYVYGPNQGIRAYFGLRINLR
jgi:outer membrane receptor for ferrienterochelin and colicins